MRALCGAIITAGAMIGLGLSAQAIGTRYAPASGQPTAPPPIIHLHQMDPALAFALVFAVCVAVIGLGIAILGLAYHHHRRERDFHFARERHATHQRTTV